MQSLDFGRCDVPVKLEHFEGPFDLLFHLIEKNEMDLYDIDMDEICQQFFTYIKKAQRVDLDVAGEFLIMAATLLHIKSRMLVPDTSTNEEDEENEDPREALVIRLLEYKKYKVASAQLKKRESEWVRALYKLPEHIAYVREYDNRSMSYKELSSMYASMMEMISGRKNKNKQLMTAIMRHDRYTVKGKLSEINRIFASTTTFNFNQCFSLKERDRLDVISGLMAILELAKFRKITVTQTSRQDDILVRKLEEINLRDVQKMIEEEEDEST